MLLLALLLSTASDPAARSASDPASDLACAARRAIAVDLVVTGDPAAVEPVRTALSTQLARACVALQKPDATKKLARIHTVTVDVSAVPIGALKPGFQMRTFQIVTRTSGADARGRLIVRSEDVHSLTGLDAARAASGPQLVRRLEPLAARIVAGIDRDLAGACPKGPSVLLVVVDPGTPSPSPTGLTDALTQRLIEGCARMVLGGRADAAKLGMTHVLELATTSKEAGTASIEGVDVTKVALELDVRLLRLPDTVLVTKHESIASMGMTLASASVVDGNRFAPKLAAAVQSIADEVLAALRPSAPGR